MGTNYYLVQKVESACPHCGLTGGIEKLHIGKSSHGWAFTLHVIPEKGLNNWADWEFVLSASAHWQIVSEYGETISTHDMVMIITERGEVAKLKRHTDAFTVGHGASWDLCSGDFS